MYYIYILKSQNNPKTYVGITTNLERRIQQHNLGYHFYTKRYIPWIYIYSEEVDSRITARTREKYLKSASGRKWISEVLFN
ncbi:GIY-YIG nuclease family protein [Candidatus Gottesmanbacteria bacterium]|nr:GIY-YIG nuclease family protein [Candidatus Gottesmanbacteria bacterium]